MGGSRIIITVLCVGLLITCITGCGTSAEYTEASNEINTIGDADQDVIEAGGPFETDDVAEGQDGKAEEEEMSFEGLSLSIFGDSISTYEGYIPEGFAVYFPYDEVTDVSQTWWMELLEDTGMELCSNDSSAGSTCVGYSMSADDPKYGCSSYRISELAGEEGKIPDVIIIYMGTNDLLNSIPLGDNDGTVWVAEGEIENFSDAYCLILDKIASNYPISRIYCCTLPPVGDWGIDVPFVTFINQLGLTSEDYSERIQIIAQNKGIPVINLYQCGINIDNMAETTMDGVHFSPNGMQLVEHAMLDGMKNVE